MLTIRRLQKPAIYFQNNIVRLLSTEGGGPSDLKRGEQARGSMRDYLDNIAQRNRAGGATGVWAKLNKKITPPTDSAKGKEAHQQPARPSINRAPYDRSRISQNTNKSTATGESNEETTDNDKQSPRILNKRFSPSKKPGNFVPRRTSDVAAPPGATGGDTTGNSFGRKKRSDADETNNEMVPVTPAEEGREEDIPAGISALLFDNDHWIDLHQKGKLGAFVSTESMDAVDELMANAFVQSFKTKSGRYQAIVETPRLNRTLIPKARSISQLASIINTPPICSAAPGTQAYDLGAEAWNVIHQNYYMTDSDKYRLCDEIAAMTARYYKYTETSSGDSKSIENDGLFVRSFRKGLPGMEEEYRLKALADISPHATGQYVQSETNWDVEAVEDEDDLR